MRRLVIALFALFPFALLLPSGAAAQSSAPSSTISDHQARPRASHLPADAQAGISGALGRDLPAYYVQAAGNGFDSANPQQKLMAHFSSEGVEVCSGDSRWQIAVRSMGYGNALRQVETTVPQASLNRVEYRRGLLTEWYVNGPLGIEQGFTITARPAQTQGLPLTIALGLSGDLTPALENDGKVLMLRNGKGPGLKYSGLSARDADGKELHARLEMQDDQLLLKIDDARGRYPIAIDPWIQLAELTASDGAASDFFGSATAISGTTVVVGAPSATIGSNAGQGAVYIFVKPTSGWQTTSTFTAKLTASNGLAGDAFGSAVSMSGTTVVIGACTQSGACVNGPGKAYIFLKPGTGWVTTSTFKAELTASDGVAADAFSNSVTIAGSVVLVGAPSATVGTNATQGAVYVFVKPSSGWKNMTETAKLTASDGKAGDSLGFTSLNGAGTIALLGAFGATVGSNAGQGAAYIFVKPTSGWKTTSTFNAKLTASDGMAGDSFGFCNFGGGCMTTDGKTVLIGAPQGNGPTGPGKAYIFTEPVSGWATTSTFTAELTSSDSLTGDNFGFSAAISSTGTTAIVGAEFATVGTNSRQGAAYIFTKPSSGWKTTSTFKAKLTASNGKPFTFFSYGGAAISGSTAAVGALGTKVGTNADQGAAYVFGP